MIRQRRFTKNVPSIQYVYYDGKWNRYYIHLDDDLLQRLALRACKNKSQRAIRGPVRVQLSES